MQKKEFKEISFFGRLAYSICCFENTIIKLNFDKEDWKIVLEILWSFCSSEYLDDWDGVLAEIIPDNLLEFECYKEDEFEYINEEQYNYLFDLYNKNDIILIGNIMELIFQIGTSHAYTIIQGYGNKSLLLLDELIEIMNNNDVLLPSIEKFKQFSFYQEKGWGKKSEDMKRLSVLL